MVYYQIFSLTFLQEIEIIIHITHEMLPNSELLSQKPNLEPNLSKTQESLFGTYWNQILRQTKKSEPLRDY